MIDVSAACDLGGVIGVFGGRERVSQQQKSPHEEFIMTFIVVGLILGISFVIWKVFRIQLLEALRFVRMAELQLGMLLHDKDTSVGGYTLRGWYESVRDVNVNTLNGDLIKRMTYASVEPIRKFFVFMLGVMTIYVIFKGPGTSFKRRMSLEGLMYAQAKSFPTITPFLKFDPRDLPYRSPGAPVPAQLPLFSEALSPEEWLAFHEVSYSGGQIDVNRAWGALAQQLGKRWEGPKKLPIHMQALYAAFCLKGVRKRKECDLLLAELAVAWSAEKGLKLKPSTRAKIRKVINDPKISGPMQVFADKHAYEATAMLRCLQRARQEGGVLAPSEFVWLRGFDRNLWYPLNNLGRKSYMAEAAGAMVHFTNELIAGQKIPTPRFDEVIRGYDAYMKSGVGLAIPERDAKAKYSQFYKPKKKKKG